MIDEDGTHKAFEVHWTWQCNVNATIQHPYQKKLVCIHVLYYYIIGIKFYDKFILNLISVYISPYLKKKRKKRMTGPLR